MATRGRPKAFDQEAALHQAMLLFWEQGYEGTSLDQLTAAMGISPSSLYSTFGGKQALYLAAVDRYLKGPGSYFAETLQSDLKTRKAFRRLFETAARELARKDQPKGCMLSLALTHCSPENKSVRTAIAQRRQYSTALVAYRLAAAVKKGELPKQTDIKPLAAYVMSALQGMSAQARDGASREILSAVGEYAMQAWPRD